MKSTTRRAPAATKVAPPRLDPKLTHRIICDAGQWAKGETELAARAAFREQHSARRLTTAQVYAVTPATRVNDMGQLVWPLAEPAPVLLNA